MVIYSPDDLEHDVEHNGELLLGCAVSVPSVYLFIFLFLFIHSFILRILSFVLFAGFLWPER